MDNLAFAARGKLDCPEAFHNRLRLTPHFEPNHLHSHRQTRCCLACNTPRVARCLLQHGLIRSTLNLLFRYRVYNPQAIMSRAGYSRDFHEKSSAAVISHWPRTVLVSATAYQRKVRAINSGTSSSPSKSTLTPTIGPAGIAPTRYGRRWYQGGFYVTTEPVA